MASMCQKNHVIRIQEITMINWGLNKVWEVNRDNYEFMNLITNDLGEAGWKKLMSRSIFWKSKTGIALPNNWEIIFRSINQRQLPYAASITFWSPVSGGRGVPEYPNILPLDICQRNSWNKNIHHQGLLKLSQL